MTTDDVKKIIENSIIHSTAHILDPMHDGQHLQALVISDSFKGLPLVKQHQMVMKPLKEALKESVHALGLKTFTEEQWGVSKSQFGF